MVATPNKHTVEQLKCAGNQYTQLHSWFNFESQLRRSTENIYRGWSGDSRIRCHWHPDWLKTVHQWYSVRISNKTSWWLMSNLQSICQVYTTCFLVRAPFCMLADATANASLDIDYTTNMWSSLTLVSIKCTSETILWHQLQTTTMLAFFTNRQNLDQFQHNADAFHATKQKLTSSTYPEVVTTCNGFCTPTCDLTTSTSEIMR